MIGDVTDADETRSSHGYPTLETVFLGDQGVGKTSIITRFMYDSFEKNYQVRPYAAHTHPINHDLVVRSACEAVVG